MLVARTYFELPTILKISRSLEHVNVVLLYFLIILVFSLKQPSMQLVPLVMLGILIQLVPSVIGLTLYKYNKREIGKNIIFFSTYGGGNRGILLLTLFFPYLIDSFVLVDLGNFISLIVFFPIISQLINNEPLGTNSAKHLIYITTAILIGMYIHSIAVHSNYLHIVKKIVSTTLIILLSIHIGLSSKTNIYDVVKVIPVMFMARFFTLIIPITLLIVMTPDDIINKIEAIIILCVFSILPISSLAQHYINHKKTKELLINNTVSTSFLFILVLLLLQLYNLLFAIIKT